MKLTLNIEHCRADERVDALCQELEAEGYELHQVAFALGRASGRVRWCEQFAIGLAVGTVEMIEAIGSTLDGSCEVRSREGDG